VNKEEVVQKALASGRCLHYLEIGVKAGDSLRRIRAREKWAVDPALKLSPLDKAFLSLFQGCRFFEMTSDRFFAERSACLAARKIDVALVDGLHTYAQALRDITNCLEHLEPGGCVVVHDCNPPSEAAAVSAGSYQEARSWELPGWTGEWCGDTWKALVHLRASGADLDICVLDCDYGVGLIKKRRPTSRLQLKPDEIAAMTYADLAARRKELLNLKDPAFADEFLGASRFR
jgi:hypothetical protein